MAKILSYYMTLVPTMKVQQEVSLPNGAVIDIDNTQFFPISKVRGTQTLRDTHNSPVDHFEGVSQLWKTGMPGWHS